MNLWLDRSLISGPYLTLVTNEKQFHKAMRHCKVPKADRGSWIHRDSADATTHTLEKADRMICCIVAIRVKKKQNPNEIIGLLIHEAVHVWQGFASRIGESNPSPEFEAYSIQMIAQSLIVAYSELTAKK